MQKFTGVKKELTNLGYVLEHITVQGKNNCTAIIACLNTVEKILDTLSILEKTDKGGEADGG